MSNLTMNDRDALMELASAEETSAAPYGACLVATKLMHAGHQAHVAVRVAMTPRMIVFRPDCPVIGEDLPRPGRDIAESIEHNTPIVVQALLYGTLAVRCPRQEAKS